jgi:recombination protein U
MAKSPGKAFEEDFKKSIPEEVYFYRLKDGTAGFSGTKNENVRFQAKNDFDCFAHVDGRLYGIELKSVAEKSLSFGNIKKNQWEGLERVNSHKDCYGFFLVNFREINETYAVPIHSLMDFRDSNTKKSINSTECREIGLLIPQKKLISRYRYDVLGWFGMEEV